MPEKTSFGAAFINKGRVEKNKILPWIGPLIKAK